MLKLREKNLIDVNNKLTEKGDEILEEHIAIVNRHRKVPVENAMTITYYTPNGKKKKMLKGDFISSGDLIKDQMKGKAYEKIGDLDNAIKAYKSAIKLGETEIGGVPPNPYMRLVIIYRKQKDREKEIEILEEGIKNASRNGGTHGKLKERLKK